MGEAMPIMSIARRSLEPGLRGKTLLIGGARQPIGGRCDRCNALAWPFPRLTPPYSPAMASSRLPNFDVEKVAKCIALSDRSGVALDVGAHVGAVSLYLARRFARVLAFEAVPETFEFLHENSRQVPNIEALNVAVGAEEAEVYSTIIWGTAN